jgi:hypothetical protein
MQKLTEIQAYEMYDEMLDECSEVKIGCLNYSASYVLQKVDPIAYRCGFNDFCDAYEIEVE